MTSPTPSGDGDSSRSGWFDLKGVDSAFVGDAGGGGSQDPRDV